MKRFGFISLITAGLMITGLNAGEIQKREVRQQKRIAQGVKSGQLTPGETARLEHKEAKLNREIRNDRRANGGKLTPKERRQINHQQNKLSRQIYRDKHNARQRKRARRVAERTSQTYARQASSRRSSTPFETRVVSGLSPATPCAGVLQQPRSVRRDVVKIREL